MHVSRLTTDLTTGLMTIRPDNTIPTNTRMTTKRQAPGTNTATRKRGDGHPETRPTRDMGPAEALNKWQGYGGRPEWGNGQRAKGGTSTHHGTGTGGNAVRPIPTGPTGGGRPNTGHPTRRYTAAKWDNLKTRAHEAASQGRLHPAKLAFITSAITAAMSEAGRPIHTMSIRIDGLTASDWKAIDSIRLNRTRRHKKQHASV